ncbi:recombination protein NinG [Quatrionicoccus australiensis]|uniref:recombination protein NinG n=1 Tax=Quatrionicoccus australiensis TaxID=138118 RepID=UPI001CFA3EF8|nr:recombination protein NinG [Quatrionicoccus australiensis]MCB4358442.1 recombination protein NinG [Quatrionicoccus australiensis]
MPRCRYCSNIYKPARTMQPGRVCNSVECLFKHANKIMEQKLNQRAKAERIAAAEDRKTVKIKLDKLKTARDWTNEAQIAFNKYVRERDSNRPCISCGSSLNGGYVGGAFDCGHYRSVGSAPHLRFHDHNAHGQCKKCNRYLSGNAADYRVGLIARIGIESLESIEADQTPRKYTIEELKAIKATYIAKLKELRK